jgi:hypothetical protein
MKKALIFLLSLAVVGAVFAADGPSLTFSGSLQTGLVYQMGDNYEDPIMWAYADDAGKDAYRLRLVGTAVNGNTGAKFRISSAATSAVALDYAWTYVDLMDAMLHLDVGYNIDDNAWRTKGDDELDFDVSTGSLKLQVKPIEGLNLGGAIGMPAVAPKAAVAANAATYTLASAAVPGVELADLTYIAGFAYAMAPFGVQAGLKADLGELTAAYAGFDYTDVIPGMSVYFETQLTTLEDFSDNGRMQFDEKAKYVTGPIEVALISYQWMYQNSDKDFGLLVKGSASYAAGNVKPGIEVVYNNDETNLDKAKDLEAGETEVTAITVKPTVEVKFTDKTKVVSGYEYVAYTNLNYDNSQKIFVNFRYDF